MANRRLPAADCHDISTSGNVRRLRPASLRRSITTGRDRADAWVSPRGSQLFRSVSLPWLAGRKSERQLFEDLAPDLSPLPADYWTPAGQNPAAKSGEEAGEVVSRDAYRMIPRSAIT